MAKRAKKKTTTKIRKKRDRRKKSIISTAKAAEPAIEADIWLAFERTRSLRGTVRETGCTLDQVRQVLDGDPGRISQILREFIEACVAEWEAKAVASHAIMDQLLDLYRGILLEIQQATEEERLTRIKDPEGYQYTVPDAVQLVAASRMLDQVARIAQIAQGISESYRGRPDENGSRREGEGDPMDWPEDRLVEWLRAGKMRVPKALEAKVAGLLAP